MRALSSLEWLVIFIIVVGALSVVIGTFYDVWNPVQANATAASGNLLDALGNLG